ncbi:MAG: ogt [Labilithrix sp.]|nr:ogt [Labilithrix sp.]
MGWLLFATDLGRCGLAWNERGLTGCQLPEVDAAVTAQTLCARAGEHGNPAAESEAPGFVREAVARLQEHLAGRPQDLASLPLDLARVSAFNAGALRAAQAVPAGQTATYGEIAARIGSPGAAQAVGRAMATNPWPIVVPCHRVVAAGGKSGGFSAPGGLATKERLLRIEGGTLLTGDAARQTSLFD